MIKEKFKDYLLWRQFVKTLSVSDGVISQQRLVACTGELEANAVCVLPAAGPGSLGDEAMLLGMKSYFSNLSIDMYPIGHYEDNNWPYLKEKIGVLPSTVEEWSYFLPKLLRFNQLFINGADMMDAGYGLKVVEKRLFLAYIASELGLEVTVTGFSFSENAPRILSKYYSIFNDNVRFCARDDFSAERFNKLTGKQVALVADLAFMMKPQKMGFKNKHVFEWINEEKAKGNKVLGVNICAHTLTEDMKGVSTQSIEGLLSIYEKALGKFLYENKDVNVLIIPHDLRGIFSDLNLAMMLRARLISKFDVERVRVLEVVCGADEIKAAMVHIDYVFSGRMHLAIASLGAGTPVACVTYQGKFDGLYKLVGLSDELLIHKSKFNAESLYNVLCKLKEKNSIYTKCLAESNAKVLRYSSLNLKSID